MTHTAVLLNTTESPSRRWPWLAGLPVLLRTVLTAERAGIQEIRIVGGQDPGKLLRRRKLQIRWQWIPAGENSAMPGELSLLHKGGDGLPAEFILLFADSVLDVEALRSLADASLNGDLARRAFDPNHPASSECPGLYLCSAEMLRSLSSTNASPHRFREYAATLREQGRLTPLAITGRLWGRASDSTRLQEIERELAHFNLKPSDGNFARFNKLVLAEPLIRFFLHTPASPNFITSMGLVLAVGAGLICAHGGYLWTLGGALLNFLSAILDHVDGMVARLKFQESHFGTWFETIVDYTSYLAVFSGLSVGLYRETGEVYNLLAGGFFLFGALTGIVLQIQQRQRAARDNPADYINRFHHSLEKNSSDFFHWVSRNLYFLVRRAVLPYFVVLFCLLSMRELLIGWVALGANLFWILLLNSNRIVRAPRTAQEN